MKFNDSTIKELLEPFQEEGEQAPYYCMGVVVATFGQALILGAATAVANTYYILGFTDRKLAMISLDMMGNPSGVGALQYKDIKSVKISKWMFGAGKNVQIEMLNGSKIKFKINKIVLGAKIAKQRENLEAICSILENKFS